MNLITSPLKVSFVLKLLKSLQFLNRIIALLFNYEIHNGFVGFNYNGGTIDFCSHVAVFITTVLYYIARICNKNGNVCVCEFCDGVILI